MSASTQPNDPSSGGACYLDVSKEALIALQKAEAMEMVVRARMHDLSNELMIVSSSAEMASLVEDRERMITYLENIRKSVERSGRMVASTAHFIRPRTADHFLPVVFGKIVKDACQIGKDIASGQIEWIQTGGGEEWTILAAKEHLLQALLSVLNNAIQAIGDQPGKIHLHLEGSGPGIRLLIGSDGPSETAPLEDRVFDPFVSHGRFRAGLGLTTARWIVETHGGTLDWCREPEPVDLPVVLELRLPVLGGARAKAVQPSTGR